MFCVATNEDIESRVAAQSMSYGSVLLVCITIFRLLDVWVFYREILD